MVPRRILSAALLAALSCGLLAPAPAQAEPYGQFFRPQDHWQKLETEHFKFYFTQDTPRTAAYLRAIAESTFARLNQYYHYEPPNKIRVILVGYTTFSNGFADSDHDRITLFTTTPDFHSRSRVPWLDNVFTHELSHILSLNTATSWWKRVPLVLGTGVARSQDSQALLKLPVYGRNYPHWFAEGVAQFDTSLLGRDGFDENRAAFQRAVYEDGLLFPLGKLAFFGGEQWYNTGLSFLRYLEERFGEGTVHRLFRQSGQHYYYLFDGLFEDTLGTPLAELERAYRADVVKHFDEHVSAAEHGRYDGEPVRFEWQRTEYRALTPQRRDILRDAYSAMPLRYLDGKLFYRQAGAISYGTLSVTDHKLSDVKWLSYGAAIAPNGPDSYLVLKPERSSNTLLPTWFRPKFESASLYVVDTEGREHRLLKESRLSEIDACPARSELAGIYDDGDGSVRLALYSLRNVGTPEVAIDPDSLHFPLPALPFDETRGPRYSPDCRKLYFSRRIGRDHDLFSYDLETKALTPISAEPAFELYPEPTRDGLYYVSSRKGTMDVYFKPNGTAPPRLVTEAITGHHHPIDTPDGLVFGRMYATGFQIHVQPHDRLPPTAAEPISLNKPDALASPELLASQESTGFAAAVPYHPFALSNLVAPSVVPLVDLEYDSARVWDGALRVQAGLELTLQDELSRQALLLRGYAGDLSSFLVDYDNSMAPVSFRVRAGWNDLRGLYVYQSAASRFEQITSDGWGFLSGALRLPLNLFYTASLTAETIRDVGLITGSRPRHYSLGDPAYGRELFGAVLSYDGIDRRDPTFRERDINKRGYRQFTLAAYYGLERVHPDLAAQSPSLHAGVTPFVRAELNYSEFIALPALAHGLFDHSLQLDLTVGYISQELSFFPFYGGGRLYSQAAPVYNASVGFAGYNFGTLLGESLINLGLAYRGPIARNLGWSWGPMYLQDVYFQLFTSWGNIWGYDRNGRRQRPFFDAASNGRQLLGDVGLDIRLGHFIQSVEANVGTTLRAVYRLVPFSRCVDATNASDGACFDPNNARGFMFYFIIGGGF
jgi:hypothetical protein